MPENGLFRNIAERGYSALLPIVPPGATISERSTLYARKDAVGKIPGVRGGDGCWRGFDWLKHTATPDDYGRWASWGAGVGLRLGSGLIAIDCDTLDQTQAEFVWFAFGECFGADAARRFGRRPKWLSLVRCADDVKYTRVEFTGYDGLKERVELLGAGRQCVVAGVHPGTSRPYEWDAVDGLPPRLDALPVVSAAQIGQFFAMLASALPGCSKPLHEGGERPQNQELLRGAVEDVKRAVSVLPNRTEDFPTRNDYLKVGYAIKAALPDDPDEAQDLWLQWCGRWADDPEGRANEPEKVLQDWRRMKPPYALGAGWLYQEADRLGGFDQGAIWFEPVEERLEFGLDTEPVGGAAGAGTRVGENSKTPLKVVRVGEALEAWKAAGAEPLIEGLLDKGAMCVLYGPSNVGKSFLALDMAAHVALGRPWGGRKVAAGGVVYVVAEGARGVYKRVAALRRKMGAEWDSAPFWLVPQPVDLSSPAGDMARLIEAVQACARECGGGSGEGGVALVVVDTLARVMAGADENTALDMGRLVGVFDRVRAATGAHLLVVHHTGKDLARGARGHSSLRAATDTELEVGEGMLSAEKQRDMEKGEDVRFSLEGVDLGVDDRGNETRSAVVQIVASDTPAKPGAPGVASDSEQIVLDAVRALEVAPDGRREGVKVETLLDHLSTQGHELTKEGLRTHLRRMNAKNLTYKNGRGAWRAYSEKVENGFDRFSSVTNFSLKQDDIQSGETVSNGQKSGQTVFD